MDVGVTLPQLEIGPEPETLLAFATSADAAGYDHLLAYDHVLGVDPDREDWEGPYDHQDQFHEPLTTFSLLAGHTDGLAYVTGILVLPQRQNALVAKQAAQVDRFSGGRLRLGVGVGWNEPEYEALGQDFSTRGRRIEEQIEVLRSLWTDELVEYDGEFHIVPGVGLNPMPRQRPIPVWMGGMAEPVKRRVARLADGWLPQFQPGPEAEEHLADLASYAEEAGRSLEDIGIQGRVWAVPGEDDDLLERLQAWRELGADHVSVSTMYQGLTGEEHVEQIEHVGSVLSEAGLL